MNMSELYKRRIRIEGKPDDKPVGYMVKVTDIETGEMVPGVASITVHLHPTVNNQAVLTYYKQDAAGKYIIDNGEPVERTAIVDKPEVAVTAMEQITYAYVLQAFALYAERVELDTGQLPVLVLKHDGSGHIQESLMDATAYLELFSDLHMLLTQLRNTPPA